MNKIVAFGGTCYLRPIWCGKRSVFRPVCKMLIKWQEASRVQPANHIIRG